MSTIKYVFWHNGTEGIKKVEVFLWLRNVSSSLHVNLIHSEVKFQWISSTDNIFERSGSPGYMTGKPVLSGRKIVVVDDAEKQKEIIKLSLKSDNWLNVLGSVRGLCSSEKKIPVNFKENAVYSCLLPLQKKNFSSKESCKDLQNRIFELLIGNELKTATASNFFNRFVGTFGNSRIQNIEDWVQILIDLSQITTSHIDFKVGFNMLTCSNIISSLLINVAYSNVGSVIYPQAKILGVSFQLGKHGDFVYFCSTLNCENASHYQYFKLSSSVNFIDVSEPPKDMFADPVGLEIKLPKDFFYPFFQLQLSLSASILFYLFFACLPPPHISS